MRLVTLANGQQVTLNKTGSVQLLDNDGRIVDEYPIPTGALLHFKDGQEVEEASLLAQWDPYNIPILSEKKGVVGFEDMLPGVTTKVEKDASGGKSMVVIEHKEDLNPQIIVKDTSGKPLATYSVPTVLRLRLMKAQELTLVQSSQKPLGKLPRLRTLPEGYLE